VIAPLTYAEAILEAHRYLLSTYVEVFAIGQGLWSPWYVGSTMRDLELEFGKARIIDTPVSEQACTGAAIGAALAGYRPIVNRGGEQGAQHSQSLHSWFAHIPGLRVVTPATPSDARDLLVASVLNDDPVVFMDDRWLYEEVEERRQLRELDLRQEGPAVRRLGDDVTLAAVGFSTRLCMDAATQLAADGVACEVIDIRVPAPLQPAAIVASVEKTGRLVVVDGDWKTCGFGGEVIASVAESISPELWRATPSRITLPDAPAPTSRSLEEIYYPSSGQVVDTVRKLLGY
jgi:pyruvate dehydrogenase E1 component beta subunit